jgi:hypothetical protein
MNGRDTRTLRIERPVIAEILRSCSHPDLLADIFDRARGLVFGRGSVLEFDAYCRQQPCILWQPEDLTQRHVTVRVTREQDPIVISIKRVVWTICHTVSAQGPPLGGDEEVLHTCGRNGNHNNGHGVCLNPVHMVRGSCENRTALRQARHLMRTLSLENVAVAR